MTEPVERVLDPRPPPVLPCTGKCRGERSTLDSPGTYAIQSGNRVVWCDCHGGMLKRASKGEFEEMVAAGRFHPSVTAVRGVTLWQDEVCLYDVLSIAEIVGK